MSDENGISEGYNECKSQLFKLCRVDSIDILLDDKNSISVAFYIGDASYYPSTENKYRMILYQPNDEIPDHFKRNFNRKITSNWFFITNDNQYFWNALIIISIILFDLFVWVFGIVKFIKYNLIHGIQNGQTKKVRKQHKIYTSISGEEIKKLFSNKNVINNSTVAFADYIFNSINSCDDVSYF